MGALPLLTFAEGRRKVDSMEIEKFTRCKYVKVRSRAYAFIYIDVDTAAVVPSAEYEKR